MMGFYSPLERFLELRHLFLQRASSQVGKSLCVADSINKRTHHTASTFAEHIGHDRSELDVSRFQDLVQAVDFLGSFIDQRFAGANQIPQIACRFGRKKAGLEETVTQQIRQPFTVVQPH